MSQTVTLALYERQHHTWCFVFIVAMSDRVDKDVANFLQGMPVLHTLCYLLEKPLVKAVTLWNQVKYVFHEGRICKTSCLWSFQGLKIDLWTKRKEANWAHTLEEVYSFSEAERWRKLPIHCLKGIIQERENNEARTDMKGEGNRDSCCHLPFWGENSVSKLA